MAFFLCFVLFFAVKAQELSHENVTTVQPITSNTSLPENNTTMEMHRITQPLTEIDMMKTMMPVNKSSGANGEEFKPSPHLETYYEYNRFPVVPAFPEAKHFSHFADLPQWPKAAVTTESTWSSFVKFPTTSATPLTSKDRPYPFYKQDRELPRKSYHFDTQHNNYEENWNVFANPDTKSHLVQKNQFDFTAPVSVPTYNDKTLNYGELEKPAKHDIQSNPWKKIIKILTAVIPIGLLISALTPSVITVTTVNGTQSRSRAEKEGINPHNKLPFALGCEERILCELLLSASITQNAEQHVQNLLDTFANNSKMIEKADEMKMIFQAVRNQDCRPIVCNTVKDNE